MTHTVPYEFTLLVCMGVMGSLNDLTGDHKSLHLMNLHKLSEYIINLFQLPFRDRNLEKAVCRLSFHST